MKVGGTDADGNELSPYDENGNIQGIERYSVNDITKPLHDFEYDYYPETNRLRSVSGYIDEILYNERGQVTVIDYVDNPKRPDMRIEYDVTGKVTRVADLETGDPVIEFAYDDRGFRMMKKVDNIEEWYIRDASGQVMAIYHRDTDVDMAISQTELPIYGASKLGMAFKNPDHYKYIYELTDHLGSVRALVTKLGLQATASMEKDDDPNGIDEYEAQYFDNLEASRHKDMSNSHSGIRMAYTHPGNPAGPTITLRVKAGDEINLEVYAKYDDTETPQVVDGSLAEALTNSVNDAVVGLEGGVLSTAVGTNIAALIAAATPAEGKPKAYLQYVLFDESFTKVGDGYIPVDKGIDKNGWKYLLRSAEVAFDGYLYAYVANESNLDVFFDDFTVQVLGTRAIRKTDYYPFGAVAKAWQNPDQTQQEKYRHGYQGQYAELDTTTGWNAFEARMYDPIIGRWLQVDPANEFESPYLSMGNDPINFVDPRGDTTVFRFYGGDITGELWESLSWSGFLEKGAETHSLSEANLGWFKLTLNDDLDNEVITVTDPESFVEILINNFEGVSGAVQHEFSKISSGSANLSNWYVLNLTSVHTRDDAHNFSIYYHSSDVYKHNFGSVIPGRTIWDIFLENVGLKVPSRYGVPIQKLEGYKKIGDNAR